MADKPILFSPPMVRALLAGRKTQTRRGLVMRRYPEFTEFGQSGTPVYDWTFRDKDKRWHDFRHADLLKLLPIQAGDRLYVREAWNSDVNADSTKPSEMLPDWAVWYVADGVRRGGGDYSLRSHRFRQAMHMPRWASRMTLDVSEVRVQRLHDISDDDCIAEGIQQTGRFFYVEEDDDWDEAHLLPRLAYYGLLDKLNGAGFADSNPWLTATTFTVQMGNIDTLAAAT